MMYTACKFFLLQTCLQLFMPHWTQYHHVCEHHIFAMQPKIKYNCRLATWYNSNQRTVMEIIWSFVASNMRYVYNTTCNIIYYIGNILQYIWNVQPYCFTLLLLMHKYWGFAFCVIFGISNNQWKGINEEAGLGWLELYYFDLSDYMWTTLLNHSWFSSLPLV